MTDEAEQDLQTAAPSGVGPQLRAARERMGLSVDDIARQTRIARRHVTSIEEGQFDDLPGRIYAIGFAKTIAKVVELDQADVAAMVRAELGEEPEPRQIGNQFAPGDPARLPGRRLVWFSLFALLLLLAGLFFSARELFAPAVELPPVEQEAESAAPEGDAAAAEADSAAAQAAPAAAGGPVVFTAEGTAWVRFIDAAGRILMEREMAEGETYTVPADAEGPQVITARPDLLAITIGGQSVPRLADEPVTLVEVPVDAQSLLTRDGQTTTAGEQAETAEPAGE
jgi:cytoskeletal protein RodZ